MSQVEYPLPMSSDDLIPHRGAMQFCKELKSYTEKRVECEIKIDAGNIFLDDDNKLGSCVLVEFIAQLFAARQGYYSLAEKGPACFGLLVGVKDFQWTGQAERGDLLQISAEIDTVYEELSLIRGEVRKGQEIIASGSLKLWDLVREKGMTLINMKHPSQPAEKKRLAIKRDFHSPLERVFASSCLDFQAGEKKQDGKASFYFEEDFPGFNGHFPQGKIFPGILMIKLGLFCLSLLSGEDLEIRQLRSAKFASLIFPNQKIDLDFSLKHLDDGLISSKIIITSQDEKKAVINLSASKRNDNGA